MAKIEVKATINIGQPREQVFTHLENVENLIEFSGFGPIPGIKSAEWESKTESVKGSIRKVTNKDGSSHREEVMVYDPPGRIEDRIFDMDSPLRFLASDVRDVFAITDTGNGSRIDRSFTVQLSSVLWYPTALLLSAVLKRAMDRHLQTMKRSLEN